MSSKNKSYMPNGGYTLTQGSNYMMDGFHFDTEYGGGPQEKARLPEARGLANLPSGMIPLDSSGISMLPDGVEHQADLNMGEITREATQDLTLVDHSWLASQPEPDLSGTAELEQVYKDLAEGHMNNPSNNQLKALEQSWGQTSTTGLDIIPNENRYHAPYKNNYTDEQSQLPGDDYREEMERSIRKLAYGHPMNVVLSEVNESQVLEVKSKLASEYGLHGRVYIKEEHFPGLFNGRWDEVINKRCATAMYIIPKNKDCAFDRFLGMEVVNEVPWNKAAKTLLPKLESYGVRLASGSAKARLQTAFIDLIEGRVNRQEKSATWFPTQLDQSSLISLDHARRELENAREENIFVASSQDVEQSKIEMKLNRIASKLINQGFLDEEQVSAVVDSDKTATKKIERLYELASTPKDASDYLGQGVGVKEHTPHKSVIESNYKTRNQITLDQRYAKAKETIGRLVNSGVISAKVASSISSRYENPEDKVKFVFQHIADGYSKNASTYEGQGVDVKVLLPTRIEIEHDFKTRSEISLEQRFARSKDKIARIIKAGLITTEEANAIIAKHQSPEDKVRAVFNRIAHKVDDYSIYEGQGKDASYHNMRKHRTHADDKVDSKGDRSLSQRVAKAQEKLSKLIQCGVISIQDVEKATKKAKTPEDKVRAVYAYLARPDQVGSYVGSVEAHHMVKKSKLDPNSTYLTPDQITLEKRNQVAMQKLSRIVKAGLISYEEIEIATQGMRTPEEKVASVFNYLARPTTTKDYDGVVSTAHIITAKNKLPTEKVKATEISEGRKIASRVDHYISNGILNEEDVNHAFSLKGEAKFKELYKLAVKGASAKKSKFKGQKYEAHIAKRASNPTKTAHEAQSDKIATWLRQKISEGSAGEELDVLVATRFSQDVLKAHSDRIASVRSEHEGLSGHVYVDASAYMTKGTEGCDKGALVHRANQIPTLLKTSKCGSCVFNTDGSCQKYNKPIIASAGEVVESPQSYQQEMIRLANASDSEQTASLFVNNYDANEFNLTASDSVSVDDAPSHEELGDVLFGGFEV